MHHENWIFSPLSDFIHTSIEELLKNFTKRTVFQILRILLMGEFSEFFGKVTSMCQIQGWKD
jgi:hypothetical protein